VNIEMDKTQMRSREVREGIGATFLEERAGIQDFPDFYNRNPARASNFRP